MPCFFYKAISRIKAVFGETKTSKTNLVMLFQTENMIKREVLTAAGHNSIDSCLGWRVHQKMFGIYFFVTNCVIVNEWTEWVDPFVCVELILYLSVTQTKHIT